MNLNFNAKKFLQLSQTIKSLDDTSFKEYIQYVELLTDYSYWFDRYRYLKVVKAFLDKKITKILSCIPA